MSRKHCVIKISNAETKEADKKRIAEKNLKSRAASMLFGHLSQFAVPKEYKKELKCMNKCKNGRRYMYPDKLFWVLSVIQACTSYSSCTIEGMVRKVMDDASPSSSTIYKRIQRLDISDNGLEKMARMCGLSLKTLDPTRRMNGQPTMLISIDSRGLKLSKLGSWIKEKWGISSPFLKLHLVINVETLEILDFKITKSNKGDASQFPQMIRKARKKIRWQLAHMISEMDSTEETAKYKNTMMKILGDGAYGTKENYNVCDKLCMSGLLKVRINSALSGGSHERNTAVREQLGGDASKRTMDDVSIQKRKENLKKWKKDIEYGKRWHSEIVFAIFKERFGEHVRSRYMKNIKQEIGMKILVYNLLICAVH